MQPLGLTISRPPQAPRTSLPSPLSAKDIQLCVMLLSLPAPLVVLGVLLSAIPSKPHYSSAPENRPKIELLSKEPYHNPTQTLSVGSVPSSVLKFIVLALSAQKAFGGSEVCDSSAITNFGSGMTTRISTSKDLLLAQPTLYTDYINATDQALHIDLPAFTSQMDVCRETGAGPNQFSELQSCSHDLFSSVSTWSSPLVALDTTVQSDFGSHYQAEASSSWTIVPYTRASFDPLTGDNGFLKYAADAYSSACGRPPYDTTKANQTYAATVARDNFLLKVSDGFTPLDTIFINNDLGFSTSFVTGLDVCRQKLTVSELQTCLTSSSEVLTTESNRLYGLISNLLTSVNFLEKNTADLDQFSNSAISSYQSTCSESIGLYNDAISCFFVPPTDPPTSEPTVRPSSAPTGAPSAAPTGAEKKDDCKPEGFSNLEFGFSVAGASLLVGAIGYYLGVTRTEKRIENEAIQKAARENAIEDTVEDAIENGNALDGPPIQEGQGLQALFQRVGGTLMAYMSSRSHAQGERTQNGHDVLPTTEIVVTNDGDTQI